MERVGCTVGHYRILEELGRGGMGVVYRAEDLRLGRHVALKALSAEVAQQEDRVARFRREARSLAAINHPCIVTLYAVEEVEGELLLAMELVEGETLADSIPPGGLELPKFFRLAIPLLDALSAAHERGIIHRDLKPGNILVTPQGRVKILDFGLAKLRADTDPTASRLSTEGLTATGALAGTPAYMSPEQMGGSPPDERSDIFSIGTILYQMVSGRHPFGGTSHPLARVVSAILRDDPPPLALLKPELPRELDRILRSALEKDPERRSQTAKDLRNQLERLEGETTRGPAQEAPAPARRRGWRLAAGGAALLLVALTSGVWILRQRRHPGSPSPLPHLTVTEFRRFSGEVGPEYYRTGLVAALGERLSGLQGVWVVPPGGDPVPDLVVEADVRRAGDALAFQLAVQDRRSRRTLASEVLEGRAAEPLDLLDRSAASVAATLRQELGLAVRDHAPPAPTRNPAAFERYLEAQDLAAGRRGAPQHDTALELLLQAEQADPVFAPARALEGEIHWRRYVETRSPASLDQAFAACGRAAEIDPRLAAAHLCLARVLASRQRRLEAQAEYLRAIELRPTAEAAYVELRQLIRDLGMPATAERTWKQVIDLYPNYWAGYRSLGGFYEDTERYTAAAEQYRRALAMAANNAAVYLNLGSADYFMGRYEEAITAWQRSNEISPSYRAYSNLGSAYLLLRRFPQAVESLEQAVRLPGVDFAAFGNLAAARYWTPGGRGEAAAAFARAAARCRETLAQEPENPGAWIWLAYDLAMLDRSAESLTALGKALELRPDDPHFFYFAARIQNRLGRPDQALAWLERAVEGEYSLAEIRLNVELDDLRDHPRFRALLGGR